MQRWRHVIWFVYMALLLLSVALPGAGNQQYVKSTRDPAPEFTFFDEITLGDLPGDVRSALSPRDAPSFNQNSVALPDNLVKSAVADTLFWVKEMIQPQWVPDDLDQRLIPMAGSLDGDDAIWARYQINGYAIQVVSTSCTIFLMVKDIELSAKAAPEKTTELSGQAIANIERFLKRSDEIRNNLPTLESHGRLIYSKPTVSLERRSFDWNYIMQRLPQTLA